MSAEEIIWYRAAKYKLVMRNGKEVALMLRSGEWVTSTTSAHEVRHPKSKTDSANNYC